MNNDRAVRLAITIASASLLAQLCAPANWHWLHWVAYLPFFWVLKREEPVANRWYALLYGTVAVAVIFRWIPYTITHFSNIEWVGVVEVGLVAELALLGAVIARRNRTADPGRFEGSVGGLERASKDDRRGTMMLAGLLGIPALTGVLIAASMQMGLGIPVGGACAVSFFFAFGYGLPYFFVWSMVHPIRDRLGDWWILAFPAWLVTVEWLSMFVLLFPYQQGVTQFQFPFTWQLASITGVWGLSFLVMLVNTAFAEGIYREREGRPFPTLHACASIIVLCCVVFYGAWRFERVEQALRDAPVLRVQQMQVATTMKERLAIGGQTALLQWAHPTSRIAPGSVDLVVWSEGASAFNPHENGRYGRKDMLASLAKRGKFELILGGGTVNFVSDADGNPIPGPRGRLQLDTAYNFVYLIGRGGEIKGRYDKTVPLPFGEYLPGAAWFPPLAWLARQIGGIGNFQAGAQTNVVDGEVRIAAPICYEAILPSTCRSFPDPELFVNMTNDGWFMGPATFQHGMLAAIRSTELGVPLVRGAYSGTSFVTEPHGHIYAETEVGQAVNRTVVVRLATFPTFYKQWGDWFVYLCMLGLLLAGLVAPWRQKEQNAAKE